MKDLEEDGLITAMEGKRGMRQLAIEPFPVKEEAAKIEQPGEPPSNFPML